MNTHTAKSISHLHSGERAEHWSTYNREPHVIVEKTVSKLCEKHLHNNLYNIYIYIYICISFSYDNVYVYIYIYIRIHILSITLYYMVYI